MDPENAYPTRGPVPGAEEEYTTVVQRFECVTSRHIEMKGNHVARHDADPTNQPLIIGPGVGFYAIRRRRHLLGGKTETGVVYPGKLDATVLRFPKYRIVALVERYFDKPVIHYAQATVSKTPTPSTE